MLMKRLFLLTLSSSILTLTAWAQGPGMGSGGGMGPGHGGGSGSGFEAFEGWQGHDLEHNLILPQVAVGGNISTTLCLYNMGDRQVMTWLDDEEIRTTGTIFLFNPDGTPLQATINGHHSNEHPFSLDPSGIEFLKITSDGPVSAGWMLIKIDNQDNGDDTGFGDWGHRDSHPVGRGERVMATVYYSILDSTGKVNSQVGVMPAIFERQHFLNTFVVAQYSDDINTGVAIVNTSGEDTTAHLTLRNEDGTVQANASLELKAGNQLARFIDELFETAPPAKGFRGILEIRTAGEGVVAMGLLSTDGVLTSLPTHHYGNWTNQ